MSTFGNLTGNSNIDNENKQTKIEKLNCFLICGYYRQGYSFTECSWVLCFSSFSSPSNFIMGMLLDNEPPLMDSLFLRLAADSLKSSSQACNSGVVQIIKFSFHQGTFSRSVHKFNQAFCSFISLGIQWHRSQFWLLFLAFL